MACAAGFASLDCCSVSVSLWCRMLAVIVECNELAHWKMELFAELTWSEAVWPR
jgi:hypothetical protein